MSANREIAYTRKRNMKEYRLPFVAKYFKQGHTYRKIAVLVKEELGLESFGVATVKRDIDTLLKEWRESRLKETDDALQLELQRNYEQMREAWEAWEKSKTDYKQKYSKQKGEATGVGGKEKIPSIQTKVLERGEKEMIIFGDPRYLAELRMLADQRIKLLGLNAPIKNEFTGKDGEKLFDSFDRFMDACFQSTMKEGQILDGIFVKKEGDDYGRSDG